MQFVITNWSPVSESNTLYLSKPDYKSGAIPLGATGQNYITLCRSDALASETQALTLVSAVGFEPTLNGF